MVTNIDDTTARHPTFMSLEIVDGTTYAVTIFSYQRYKFKLYQIASRIMAELYLYNSSDLSTAGKKTEMFNEELTSWYEGLPSELRYAGNGSELHSNTGALDGETKVVFELQALALQLAYDNIQILLHRPFLQYSTITHETTRPPGACSSTSGMHTPDVRGFSSQENVILAKGKAQCLESALRTSKIRVSTVEAAKHTHASSYIGIHMFTAGMVLSIVALSQPLSDAANEAKSAIARIVSANAAMENKALLSAQSEEVMRNLMRLILEKEMEVIFSSARRQEGPKNRSERGAQGYMMGSGDQTQAAQSISPRGNVVSPQPQNSLNLTTQQEQGLQHPFCDESCACSQAVSSFSNGKL
jgi:hypothetical protein